MSAMAMLDVLSGTRNWPALAYAPTHPVENPMSSPIDTMGASV